MADEKKLMNRYQITGIFRMDLDKGKRHVVDFDHNWTEKDARNRLSELKIQSEHEMRTKRGRAVDAGSIGMVTTEYNSDFDLLDLRIEVHQITPWEVLE